MASRFLLLVRCLALLLPPSGAAFAQSDTPLHYYDSAIGFTGPALKAALNAIIRNHTVIPYTSTQTDTWDAVKVLDEAAPNPNDIVLIYSELEAPKSDQYTGSTGTWEREHLWPQSFGIIALNGNSRARSDLFNLRPIDRNVNSSRGNKYYDYSLPPVFTHPEAPGSTYDSNSWEPRDDEKGALARAMFYMAVRYDGRDVDVPDLELSDTPDAATYRFGKLSTLLAWHRAFAVTTRERQRNTRIYTDYQHNRNPFTDHPEYAEMVFLGLSPYQAWKDLHFTAAELGNPSISGDTADPDGDGLTTLFEYVLARDPRQPETSAPVTVTAAHQGMQTLILSFVHNRNATDVTLSYQTSTDLRTWTAALPQPVSTVLLSSDMEQITATFASSSPTFFARVQVTRISP